MSKASTSVYIMKRSLKDVASEYAQELFKSRKTAPAKMCNEHVVDVLTRLHDSSFVVAANGGWRPQVCKTLKGVLGKHYSKLCLTGSAKDAVAPPELPSAPPNTVEASTPTVDEMATRFPSSAAVLLRDGVQSFSLLTPEEVAIIRHALSTHDFEKAPKLLHPALGNGTHGAYATISRPLPALLQRVEEAAREWIIAHAGPLTDVKVMLDAKPPTMEPGDKVLRGTSSRGPHSTLLLRYGLGGINYAHHDSCGDFQALLLLSQPGVDYTGGAFYLGDANPPFSTKAFPFTQAGELLVFRGRKGRGQVDYLHGMREVQAGSGEVTRRFAVGFFQ